MKAYRLFPLLAATSLLVISCGDKTVEPVTLTEVAPTYSGEKAVQVRDETIVDINDIKNGVRVSIYENLANDQMDKLVSDLASMRPRLEYIKMQAQMLPKKELMVVKGNLAVASNQLERELTNILEANPGDDDLAVEIANIRQGLSPIDLESVVQKF